MTGTILFQTDDDLNESNLATAFATLYSRGYVESGCTANLDGQANTLAIDSGKTFLTTGDDGRFVRPDAENALSLPVSSGTNYIYLTADASDTSNSAVSFTAESTDAPPSGPSHTLKLFEVDTSDDTVTAFNDEPPAGDDTGPPSSTEYDFEDLNGNNSGNISYDIAANSIRIKNEYGSTLMSLPNNGTRPTISGSKIVTEADNVLTESGRTFGPTAPSNPAPYHVWYYYPPQS